MTMSRRTFIGTVGMGVGAIALPVDFLSLAADPKKSKEMLDGWVTLATPAMRSPGFEMTPAVIRQLADNFDKPVLLDLEFRSTSGLDVVGWVSEVKLDGDVLKARLELPSFKRPLLKEWQAIVPGFIANWRSDDGKRTGAKLVAAALTNHPAVPGTELR